tara:strand:+ start:372 stop:2006 length:1635 start_codon:yes stop_codon:yes gene_type:complete
MPEIQIPEPIFLERLGGDEIYGFGQDGDVTIASNTSLTRDMYYNNLTINANCDLDTNGYKIFVKGTLTFADATSRIGRFSSKTTAGTLKGGSAAGTTATDTLGGEAGDSTFKVVSYDNSNSVFEIDGTDQAAITMYHGFTYELNQSHYTNKYDWNNNGTLTEYTIRISETSDGTHGGGSEYTTGVTVSGTPGTDGKTVIAVTDSTPSTLYYYAEEASGRGGQINVSAAPTPTNQFFSGTNEFFNLTTAITGSKFDQATGTFKAVGGGSGGSDGTEIHAAQDGLPGRDTNWANRNTVGASGGKGTSGNAATPGTGAAGGGVVVVIAKTVSGNGTIRADGDDGSAATQGTSGTPAPDAQTPGNNYSYGYSYPGNNYSYGYSYPGNSGSNPTNYGSNPSFTHYHYNHYHPGNNPSPPINNYVIPGSGGFSHQHYHLHPGNNYSYPGNNFSNPTNYGANYGSNNTNYGSNSGSNPTNYHPGGAGGAAGKAKGGFNAGGGTVILVTGTKPLPGSLTLAAAAGTSGAGTATAGTVVTVFNIAATDTDPGA